MSGWGVSGSVVGRSSSPRFVFVLSARAHASSGASRSVFRWPMLEAPRPRFGLPKVPHGIAHQDLEPLADRKLIEVFARALGVRPLPHRLHDGDGREVLPRPHSSSPGAPTSTAQARTSRTPPKTLARHRDLRLSRFSSASACLNAVFGRELLFLMAEPEFHRRSSPSFRSSCSPTCHARASFALSVHRHQYQQERRTFCPVDNAFRRHAQRDPEHRVDSRVLESRARRGRRWRATVSWQLMGIWFGNKPLSDSVRVVPDFDAYRDLAAGARLRGCRCSRPSTGRRAIPVKIGAAVGLFPVATLSIRLLLGADEINWLKMRLLSDSIALTCFEHLPRRRSPRYIRVLPRGCTQSGGLADHVARRAKDGLADDTAKTERCLGPVTHRIRRPEDRDVRCPHRVR